MRPLAIFATDRVARLGVLLAIGQVWAERCGVTEAPTASSWADVVRLDSTRLVKLAAPTIPSDRTAHAADLFDDLRPNLSDRGGSRSRPPTPSGFGASQRSSRRRRARVSTAATAEVPAADDLNAAAIHRGSGSGMQRCLLHGWAASWA
jgi:hypothetical protein